MTTDPEFGSCTLRMEEGRDGWEGGWMEVRKNGWVGGRVDGWVGGWVDEVTGELQDPIS